MDILSLLRDAWRITWQRWTLWLLSLLMFVAMVPSMVLAGGFGGVAGLMAGSGLRQFGLDFLYAWPAWSWVMLALVLWVALVVATTLTWLLQAATVRGAALAADQAPLTLKIALAIGRQRLWSLVKLGLTFGVLMMALALMPPLGAILISLASRGQTQTISLLQLTQTSLLPLNSALGLALFLLMMAVAVEDLTPLKAVRRTWGIFRRGWWGFLLVFGLSALPSVAVFLLVLPLAIALPFAFLFAGGWIIPLLCGLVVAPLLIFVLLFTSVFTTTMYTLVYRAAARLTAPPAAPSPAGPAATPPPA